MENLKPSARSREYVLYSPVLRGQVAYRFLTESNLGHRRIDDSVLGVDSKYSRGYQSMGILHFQGLYKEHAGAFLGVTLDDVISNITGYDHADRLLSDLNSYRYSNQALDALSYHQEFSKQIEFSLEDDQSKRIERLSKKKNSLPKKFVVLTSVYERDPDVVAEALFRSKGICDRCKKEAPFVRKKNGQPYLEVHHLKPLSQGGADDLSNVISLCPNCHRELHFG
jgi:5-methylcytosine-specific restriction protein A